MGGPAIAWTAANLWSWTLLVGLLPACSSKPASPAPVPEDVLEIHDELLERRIADLARRSATWRHALDSLRYFGFRVIVTRPDAAAELPGLAGYQPSHVGEVLPIRGEAAELAGVVVTVDLDRLERLAARAGVGIDVLEGDVDRILIHEIYGHVLPLARSRDLARGCDDPRPGEPPLAACAIQRENHLRMELGMERRTSYDLRGLRIGQILYGPPPPERP